MPPECSVSTITKAHTLELLGKLHEGRWQKVRYIRVPGSAIRCGFLSLLCGSAHAEGNRGWWAAQCHEVTRFLCLVALFHCSVVVRGHGLVTVTQAFRIVAGVMTGVRSTQQRPRGGSQILLASTFYLAISGYKEPAGSGVVVFAFNLSMWEAEAGRCVCV